MKIVLLGYMASGKSGVGVSLSKLTGFMFIDLDKYIEDKEQKSIKKIFKIKGEEYFREVESKYLKELLESSKNFILSLGGGTPCFYDNIEIINKKSTSIYLKTLANTIFERLQSETAQRPLVATISIESLKNHISKHLLERNLYYERANFTISTDNKTIDEIANEIKKLI